MQVVNHRMILAWRTAIALLVGLALAFAMSTPASAAEPKLTAKQSKEVASVSRVIDQARSGKVVNYKMALKAAGAGYEQVALDYMVGALSAGGSVKGTATELRTIRQRSSQLGISANSSLPPLRADMKATCVGKNELATKWYGFRLMLSTCNVSKIQGHAVTIGVVAGVLGVVFNLEPRSKAIIAATLVIVGAGAWALGQCNHKDRGVKVYKYLNAALSGWCLSQ